MTTVCLLGGASPTHAAPAPFAGRLLPQAAPRTSDQPSARDSSGLSQGAPQQEATRRPADPQSVPEGESSPEAAAEGGSPSDSSQPEAQETMVLPQAPSLPPAEPSSEAPRSPALPAAEPEDDYESSPPVGATQLPRSSVEAETSGQVALEPSPIPQPQKPLFNTLILAEAVAKYGGFGGSLDRDDERKWDGRSTGLVGGQLTLGLMPGGKYFTMAARLSGGAFLNSEPAQSTIGASMLFGANFLRNAKGDTYSYALAGAGVEFLPGLNQDMLAFHLVGGTVVGGMSFSAGVDLGTNEEVGFAIFGLQLGWGHLY